MAIPLVSFVSSYCILLLFSSSVTPRNSDAHFTPQQSKFQHEITHEGPNTAYHPDKEWVMIVPSRLTQIACGALQEAYCVSRAWHIEGRYGSRTHKIDDHRMGIPIVSKDRVIETAVTNKALRDLLGTPLDTKYGSIDFVYKEYTESKRAYDIRPHDGRIHLERAPSSPSSDDARIGDPAVSGSAPPAFTYAELFAGIGGFGVALEALGGECVFCSELEEACRDVYTANLKVSNLYGDIYQVADTDLPAKNLDLLVGGFPCQPFSAMGQQPGFDCLKGHLFEEIVRVLKVSKPKAFLLENVPGLLQMKDTLQIIVAALEGAGYTVTLEALDARGLTATSRKRLYFVGLRNDSSCSTPFEFPYVPDLGLRAHNVVQYEPLTAAEEALLRITDEQLERMEAEPYWRPAHLAWPNKICNTLVSHYGKAVGRGHSQLVPAYATIGHEYASRNPRRFTPRECARIMGFPNCYVLPPKKRGDQGEMARTRELYRMFGNAVCPPVIAVLAGAILDRCPDIQGYSCHTNWVDWGRETAVRLAHEATIPSTAEDKMVQDQE